MQSGTNGVEFVSILENEYKGSVSKELMEEGLPCDCYYDQQPEQPGQRMTKLMKACGTTECINRALAIECDPSNCPCGSMCQNQRFQKRLYAGVEVRTTPGKGSGLFALENIDSGSFVIEYIGEVLDPASFSKRQSQLEKEGQKHFYFMTLRSTQTIDASRKGNLSRFINHSCNPNCATEKWIVNRRMCVGIFAIKPIKKGTELTFDYKFERFGNKAQTCHCGEPNCNGFIGKKKSTSYSGDESDDYEDAQEKSYFTKSTFAKLLKRARPMENSEGIYKICKELVRAESDVHSLFVNLKSLSATQNQSVLRRFLHLHGLSILRNIFSRYLSYPQVMDALLETLDKLPICTKNSIEESKIIEIIEEHRTSLDGETVDGLITKWNSLENVYRIPKIKSPSNEIVPDDQLKSCTDKVDLLSSSSTLKRSNEMFSSLHQPKRIEKSGSWKSNDHSARNTSNWHHNDNRVSNQQRSCLNEQSNFIPPPPQVPIFESSSLVEGVSQKDLEGFMAKTKALMKSKQESSPLPTDQSDLSKEAKDKYRELISVIVVKSLSKNKASFSNDTFKKIARKLTHSLLEKEIKLNPSLSLPPDGNLSEERVRMIKKYCDSQLSKILSNSDWQE